MGESMTPTQIFGLQFAMSLLLSTLVARWYVMPHLAALPPSRALTPLLFLHASRHIGMVFLVPTVVGTALPRAFAVPAAYGDLLAALLALAAIFALRSGSAAALPLVWLFNILGVVDLLYALMNGLRHDVQLGSAYYIPIVIVPALLVTHAVMFALLLQRRARPAGRD